MMKTDGKGFFLIIEKVNTIPVIQNASQHDLCKQSLMAGALYLSCSTSKFVLKFGSYLGMFWCIKEKNISVFTFEFKGQRACSLSLL